MVIVGELNSLICSRCQFKFFKWVNLWLSVNCFFQYLINIVIMIIFSNQGNAQFFFEIIVLRLANSFYKFLIVSSRIKRRSLFRHWLIEGQILIRAKYMTTLSIRVRFLNKVIIDMLFIWKHRSNYRWNFISINLDSLKLS